MRENMVYNPHYYQIREFQLERMLAIVRQTKEATPGGVVFFGDSLTELCPIDRLYPELPVKYNCGIGGADSEELLWIVDEAVIKYRPRVVVLMVGTNDLGKTAMNSPKAIATNVKALIDLICGNLPSTKVLLLSPLPCMETKQSYHVVRCMRSNDLLRMTYEQERELVREPNVSFLDVFPHFLDETGDGDARLYVDGLHINDEGYDRLAALVKPEILRLLGE